MPGEAVQRGVTACGVHCRSDAAPVVLIVVVNTEFADVAERLSGTSTIVAK